MFTLIYPSLSKSIEIGWKGSSKSFFRAVEAATVYPDIIIHKRDSHENLVVIEAKKSTNREVETDILKLKQFKQKLGYLFCYRLILGVGKSVNRNSPSFRLEEIN
ncbi:MAG: hypothetical protein ACYCPP_03625 [Nitrososphaerales archaeon]